MTASRHHPKRARGFTLVEVLIAILLFSVGILGAVGLQARMLQASAQNTDRARASMLANEIVSQMWAQGSAQLSPEAVATWRSRVADSAKTGLPNGSGSVAYTVAASGTTAVVTVNWKSPAAPANAASNSFATSVVMP
jgi:type IV pilus assembly protein PilV